MIKKHLIPSMVIIALLVMAKVFAYTLPNEKTSLKNNNLTTIKEDTEEPEFTIAQLEFANETLPLGDNKVAGKMKRILVAESARVDRSTSLLNLSSHPTHRPICETS